MFTMLNLVISVLFIDPSELRYRGRSLKRVWFTFMVTLGVLLACIGGVDASPAPIQSVVIETTGEGLAPSKVTPAQAKVMARRAALISLIRNACREVGANHGAVRNIYSEQFDGHRYVIVADVQVFSDHQGR